jgi:hypothetical protein
MCACRLVIVVIACIFGCLELLLWHSGGEEILLDRLLAFQVHVGLGLDVCLIRLSWCNPHAHLPRGGGLACTTAHLPGGGGVACTTTVVCGV